MAIKGLTDKGLSFPQIGRIKKGEMRPTKKTKDLPKEQQVMRPVDLDYFKVEFADNEEGERLAAIFLGIYGPKPTRINIRLPFNDIVLMWDGFLEAYTASRLLARSDGPTEEGGIVLFRCDGKTGETIVRNGENIESGKQEPHPEDNIAGYDYQNKPVYYSPIGRLKVIVPELKEAAYMLFTTGSWNDIRFISKQLAGLKMLNQDKIKGVPLELIRSDHEVMVPIDGKKQRMTKSLISVKADPDWVAARLQEDMQLAFPQRLLSAISTPGEIVEESETEALSDLTHPSNWGKDEVIEGEVVPESPAEAPETAPEGESTRTPHGPQRLRDSLQKTIQMYDGLIEKDPGKYAVQVVEDCKVIASVINEYVGGLKKSDGARYAIFTYLLGKGKGSTKEWTPQEIGTIKNIWLKIGTYGDILGAVEEEELRLLWNHVQVAQGQESLFS